MICSPLLSQYQSFLYDTVHYCPSPRPIATIAHYYPITSPTDTLQCHSSSPVHYYRRTSPIDTTVYTTVPELIRLYATVHYCPSTNLINTLQATTAPVPVLVIPYSPLLSQYYSYATVHYCPRTNPTYKLQYNTAQVSALLICHSPLLAQYQSY